MAQSAQDHAATFDDKRRTMAVLVVALAFVMDLLDGTIVNIAIPAIQNNLHASYASIQWMIAGYVLSFAVLLVTGGRMGDVFGYKKIFAIGVGGFMLTSLLSGVSWNPEVLIGARLLQGAMAALMVPQVLAVIQLLYKADERTSINGMFGALGGMAATLGPVIGGLLIKANVAGLNWRPIFLINVPVGLFALLAAAKYLPQGKSAHPLKLDAYGTLLIIAAMGLLIFPLIQGRELGWPAWSFAMMIASVPCFGLFAWWQRRKARLDGSPLVMPSLFKQRPFRFGLVASVLLSSVMACFGLSFTLLLQLGLGYSAIHAALTGLFVAVGIAGTMGVLGKTVIPKLGRLSLTLGAVVLAAGTWVASMIATHVGSTLTTWQLAPALLVMGIGMGLVFGSLMAIILSEVDPREAGAASGTANAVQQIGAAVGVALIGVVFFGHLHAPGVPAASAAVAHQATATNFIYAFKWGVWLQLVLLALSIAVTFFLPRHIKSEAFKEVPQI